MESHPNRLRRGLDRQEQPVRAVCPVVPLSILTSKVYARCMTRINVDIDDQACAEVMRRYRLATKREAINLALRMLAAEPASVDEVRSLRGIGWEGDLDAMRSTFSPQLDAQERMSYPTCVTGTASREACPDPRNPVRHNENETKERGLKVLKGLKLSHPSQTVSRPRRLPCARPQNSFKHPAGRANLSETN